MLLFERPDSEVDNAIHRVDYFSRVNIPSRLRTGVIHQYKNFQR